MISALGIVSCGNSFSKNTPVQLCFSRGHSHIASVRLSAEDWGIICSVIAEWLNFSLCKKYHNYRCLQQTEALRHAETAREENFPRVS